MPFRVDTKELRVTEHRRSCTHRTDDAAGALLMRTQAVSFSLSGAQAKAFLHCVATAAGGSSRSAIAT